MSFDSISAQLSDTWPCWVVTVTLVVAAVIDGLKLKVPNWITFPMIASGWAYSVLLSPYPGWDGFILSLIGTAVGLAVLLPAYAVGGMGAGDVKLLGAMGAWLGPGGALIAAFFTAIAGGVMALIVVLARGYLAETFRNLWAMLMHWRVFGLQPVPDHTLQTSRGPRLAYALPIAAGALVTLWMR